jgi:hypothetical protein
VVRIQRAAGRRRGGTGPGQGPRLHRATAQRSGWGIARFWPRDGAIGTLRSKSCRYACMPVPTTRTNDLLQAVLDGAPLARSGSSTLAGRRAVSVEYCRGVSIPWPVLVARLLRRFMRVQTQTYTLWLAGRPVAAFVAGTT